MKGMCENYDLTMPSSVESLCRNELPNGRKGGKKMGIERGLRGREGRRKGKKRRGKEGRREGRKRGGARELGEK